MDARKLALDAIEKIINKKSFANIVVNEYLNKFELSVEDRSLFTNLVYGTIQHMLTLDYYLEPYIRKRVKSWVKHLLNLSVYQIIYLRIPEYAVVNEAVDIANIRDRAIGSFVNAVLRNLLRNNLRSLDELDEINMLSIKYSHPAWLVAFMLKDYSSEEVVKMLEEFSIIRTESYRINTLKMPIDEMHAILDKNDIFYITTPEVPCGFTPSVSLTNHPLLKEGLITVQDLSSQLVSLIADVKKESTVLDLCAAPGGKTAHLAALMENTGKIYACDIYPHKIKLMENAFKRLNVKNVHLEQIDARTIKDKVNSESFDYIFADCPCSGLGVIGHKVDLKYHVSLDAISEVTVLQKEILEATWMLVKVGGYYIYSTCTINKDENENQITEFLQNHPNFEKEYEQQILPTTYHSDGFYICKMRRKS